MSEAADPDQDAEDDQPWTEKGGVRFAKDPTKAVLSESALSGKWLCDYVSTVAVGCRHSCRFCYVPTTPQTRMRVEMLKEMADVDDPQGEWGEYVLRRFPEEMASTLRGKLARKRTWKQTAAGKGVVGISYHTDAYQDPTTGATTRAIAREFFRRGVPVRIQTRNPAVALQDRDLYRVAAKHGLVTIGTSLPSFDAERVAAMEPQTPPPAARLKALSDFASEGIPTFVSVSPTYPTMRREGMRYLLDRVDEALPTLDVVFHEALNPRGQAITQMREAAREAELVELAECLEAIEGDTAAWFDYATEQLGWMQELGNELELPVNLWPGDVVDEATGAAESHWLGAKLRPSPERFPEVDDPSPSDDILEPFADDYWVQ